MPDNPHVDGRTNGAALRPLSALQIKTLIALFREAFLHLIETEQISENAEFNAWRHQHCLMVVERRGLRDCRNEDFLPLKAHCLRLQGREAEAAACRERHEIEPRTWALNALHKACSDAADVMPNALNYAAGFLRNKRGLALDDADQKALMHASFVVARKAEQLRKAQKGAPA